MFGGLYDTAIVPECADIHDLIKALGTIVCVFLL